MLRITITVLLLCCVISLSHAQDSTKKAASAPAKTALANTYPKPSKYHTYRYHSKADSAAKAQAVQTGAVKPDTAPGPPVFKSLGGQYQYVLTKVYHYQQPVIAALWKSVSDSLGANRRKVRDIQHQLATQNKTIDSLKADATARADALSARIDEISVLGISLPKTAYNLIVWSLVAFFVIVTFAVIGRSGSFKREAKYRTQLFNELEEEFKAYKTKANDKEKKLARELQTERNKLDELLGR